MAATAYTLRINDQPVGDDLLAAIQRIEVEDNLEVADVLRLQIGVSQKTDGSGWTVVDDGTFNRLDHLRLSISISDRPSQPLIDAYVIEVIANLSNQPGSSTLTILAMDATALMNIKDKVRPWPDMADSDIAEAIFGEYDLTRQVDTTTPTRQDTGVTTMQRGSDIRFLRRLADRNGFECYVETDPQTGAATGYFRAPQLQAEPQGVLSVSMGLTTNVDSFNARFAMLEPTTAKGSGVDADDLSVQSADAESLSLTALGQDDTVQGDSPRISLLCDSGLSEADELQTFAQAVVDRSAWAVVAEGELHTAAYGDVVRAKRPILVRGAGRQYSGTYYVERVLHTLAGTSYTQHFTLRRNALGLMGSEDFAAAVGS